MFSLIEMNSTLYILVVYIFLGALGLINRGSEGPYN